MMTKKTIPIDDLRKGMYVVDLRTSWFKHPFWKNSFKIRTRKDVDAIVASGIRTLDIDTAKGLDVARRGVKTPVDSKAAPTKSVSQKKPGQTVARSKTSFAQEIKRAKQVQKQASRLAVEIMEDVRFGQKLHIQKVTPIVSEMVDSVFRNKDALLSLGLVRQMDRYTYEHSVSVAVLMMAFAKDLDMAPDEVHAVGLGGLLHDIGKARMPDEVLNKPGPLTEEEFDIMRQHVHCGLEILSESPELPELSLRLVAEHHERHDGSGYPERLAGDDISQAGKMAAIVDVYDALSSDRVYHDGQHPTIVLRRILEWSRDRFDQELTQRFIQCVGIYPVGTLVQMSDGTLAVVVRANPESLLRPVVRVIYKIKDRSFVTPHLLDLADQSSVEPDSSIVGTVDPRRWAIKPEVFVH